MMYSLRLQHPMIPDNARFFEKISALADALLPCQNPYPSRPHGVDDVEPLHRSVTPWDP